MDPATLPWDKGIATVLAMVVVALGLHACYRVIPRGFRTLAKAIDRQTVVLTKSHDDAIAKLKSLEDAVKHLENVNSDALEKIARTRTRPRATKRQAKRPG